METSRHSELPDLNIPIEEGNVEEGNVESEPQRQSDARDLFYRIRSLQKRKLYNLPPRISEEIMKLLFGRTWMRLLMFTIIGTFWRRSRLSLQY